MRHWTYKEIQMFETMSNEKIAEKTGRSIGAIQNKRYRLQGNRGELSDRKEDGEYRILKLASEIGVKLLPKNPKGI